MPQPEALAADPLPPELTDRAQARGERWRLTADAPEPDLPRPRNRKGARRGMLIILLVGGLFWAAVIAVVLVLRR
jgi:hypothetical protein